MKVLYRISDGGNAKEKLTFVYDKKRMFLHFIKIFQNHDIYVFADNVSEETYKFLKTNYDESKIFRISLGNAASFMHIVNFAIQNFNNDDKIYFAEDDYVYTKNAPEIIEEGLSIANYSSGYDHPDKYMNHNEGGPNPFIENGGEQTRVIMTKNSHWKFTNSCCMTFATTVNIVKEDYDIFQKYCLYNEPWDFCIFCDLYKIKNRTLVSSIPGVSTHGETAWLTRLVDWENKFEESFI